MYGFENIVMLFLSAANKNLDVSCNKVYLFAFKSINITHKKQPFR